MTRHRGATVAPTPTDWRRFRLWVYGLGAPLLAVLVFYGLIDATSVPLWLALLGALVGPAGAEAAIARQRQTARGRRDTEGE